MCCGSGPGPRYPPRPLRNDGTVPVLSLLQRAPLPGQDEVPKRVPSRSGQIPNEKSRRNRLKRRRFGGIGNVHSAKATFLLDSKFHYGEREGDPPAADGLSFVFLLLLLL